MDRCEDTADRDAKGKATASRHESVTAAHGDHGPISSTWSAARSAPAAGSQEATRGEVRGPPVRALSRPKIMANLLGMRETVTHVPERLLVQLLVPELRTRDELGPGVHRYDNTRLHYRAGDGFVPCDGAVGDVELDDPDALADLDEGVEARTAAMADEREDDRCPQPGAPRPRSKEGPGSWRDTSPSVLLLTGADEHGRTVTVRVSGAGLRLYVQCADSWTRDDTRQLVVQLEGRLGLRRDRRSGPREPPSIGVQVRRMAHAYGFTPASEHDLVHPRAHVYCILAFPSMPCLRRAMWLMRNGHVTVGGAYDASNGGGGGRGGGFRRPAESMLGLAGNKLLAVHESRVGGVHKALDAMGLTPSAWFEVRRWTEPTAFYTHSQIEVDARCADVAPRLDVDRPAPVWKAYWDIEVYSHDGSFPRASERANRLICIGTHYRQHHTGRRIDTCHHLGACAPTSDVARLSCYGSGGAQRRVARTRPLAGATAATEREKGAGGEQNKKEKGEEEKDDGDDDDEEARAELELIEAWRDEVVLDAQAQVVGTYNGYGFDFKFVAKRAAALARAIGRRSRLFRAGIMVSEREGLTLFNAKGDNRLRYVPMPGRLLTDMYQYVKKELRLVSYGLAPVCEHVFSKGAPELLAQLRKIDLAPAELWANWASGDPDRCRVNVEYCARDCALPLELEEKLQLLTKVIEMSRVTYTPASDVLLRGEQVKTWNLLLRRCHAEGYVMNRDPSSGPSITLGHSSPSSSAASPSPASARTRRDSLTVGGRGDDEGGDAYEAQADYGEPTFGAGDPERAAERGTPKDRSGDPALGTSRKTGGGNVASAATATDGAAKKYKGAIVLPPKTAYYDVPIATLDFASLYPSIMMANNLCPSSLITDDRVKRMYARACRVVDERLYRPVPVEQQDPGGDRRVGAIVRWMLKDPAVREPPPPTPAERFTMTERERAGEDPRGPSLLMLSPDGRLAVRLVTPAPGRTHWYVCHVIGIMPVSLRNLKANRAAVKKMQKAHDESSLEHAVLDNRQLSLKLSMNAAYGFFGAQAQGMLACVPLSESVTCIGRKMIFETRDYVNHDLAIYMADAPDHMRALVSGADVRYGDTDSVFVLFRAAKASAQQQQEKEEEEENEEKEKKEEPDHMNGLARSAEGVRDSLEVAKYAAAYVSSRFADDVSLEVEKAYWPWISFGKKQYAGVKWLDNCFHAKNPGRPSVDSRGVPMRRRDVWAGMRNLYAATMTTLLQERDVEKCIRLVMAMVDDIVADRLPIDAYVNSMTLKRTYDGPLPAHAVVRDKMRRRSPGSEPKPGNRVPFVITVNPRGDPKQTASRRAEDPEHVRAAGGGRLRIDREYYVGRMLEVMGKLLYVIVKDPESLFIDALKQVCLQQSGQLTLGRFVVPRAPSLDTTASGVSAEDERRPDDGARASDEGGVTHHRDVGGRCPRDDRTVLDVETIAARAERRRTGDPFDPGAYRVKRPANVLRNASCRVAKRQKKGPLSPAEIERNRAIMERFMRRLPNAPDKTNNEASPNA